MHILQYIYISIYIKYIIYFTLLILHYTICITYILIIAVYGSSASWKARRRDERRSSEYTYWYDIYTWHIRHIYTRRIYSIYTVCVYVLKCSFIFVHNLCLRVFTHITYKLISIAYVYVYVYIVCTRASGTITLSL